MLPPGDFTKDSTVLSRPQEARPRSVVNFSNPPTIDEMLTVDADSLTRLMKERLGKMSAIGEAHVLWPIQSEPVNRATIFRWLRNETVPSPELFYALAGTLDVDPLVLLKPAPATSFASICQAVGDTLWSRGQPKDLKKWLFLAPLAEGTREWPPQELAVTYFKREWHWREFIHDPAQRSNYYARFEIEVCGPTLDKNPLRDKVWHFAFRDARRRNWRPYGCIRGTESHLELYGYGGTVDQAPYPESGSKFAVETWFGLGKADFRLACLHDFTVTLTQRADEHLPRVRFNVNYGT